MISFESEGLKYKVKEILDFLEDAYIDFDFYDFEEIDNPEIDEYKVINHETEITIYLPACDDNHVITIGDLISLYSEIKKAKFVDNSRLVTPKRILIRVDLLNRERLSYIDNSIFSITLKYKDQEYSLDLIWGDIVFGIGVVLFGEYEDFLPPISSEDLFVEISSQKSIDNSIVEELFEAYIFEINTSLNIDLQESPRPNLPDYDAEDEDEEFEKKQLKLRPLILGDGTRELLKLFMAISLSQQTVMEQTV